MIEETEVWRDAVGYDGKYSVSSHGRIRSNFTISKLGKKRLLGTILKTTINHRGYEKVKLNKDGTKTVAVHRLVCTAFHENPENKPQVNHKDLNQLNNHWLNLEWNTAKENTNHAQINGRIPIAIPYVKKGRSHLFKPVINLITGEVGNAKQISQQLGIRHGYFSRMLLGTRPNTTSYRYVGKEETVKHPIYGIEQPRPIALFDMQWNLIGEFEYLSNFRHIIEVNLDTVRAFVKGEIGQYKGYKFKLIDNTGNHVEPIIFVPKIPVYHGIKKGTTISEQAKERCRERWVEKKKQGYEYPSGKEIVQMDLNGNKIQTFKSISEAIRSIGANDKSNLRKVLTGRRGKTYKGFKWEYA